MSGGGIQYCCSFYGASTIQQWIDGFEWPTDMAKSKVFITESGGLMCLDICLFSQCWFEQTPYNGSVLRYSAIPD